MGTTVNGIGGDGRVLPAQRGMLAVQSADTSQTSVAVLRRTEKQSQDKKKLRYNHREIAGQLLRAKKSQNAAGVLTRAKSRLAMLQRQAGSGQYDAGEVANALAHARRMVRCAQLKVRNLREEEQAQKTNHREKGVHEQQKQNEVKRRVAQKERALKSKLVMEELQEAGRQKRAQNEILQKRRMHRNQEQSRMQEADMKYIRGILEQQQGAQTGQGMPSPVVLDLSMEAMALAEIQMLAQAQQEIETEVQMEMAAEEAVALGEAAGVLPDGGSRMTEGAAGEAAAPIAVGGGVDMSI